MVMQPLQIQLHTDVLHSPNHDPMPKLREIPDHTMEIIIILVLDIPHTNKMMDITGISRRNDQQHARFDEKYNQWYSPPAYPPTPSLNSTFPEALSRSLLQVAENQSKTIEVMKASQEA